MNAPRVSVIIPAYNVGKHLDETLGSVLAQTYRDFEIVVVNDGSTDDTADVLRKYVDAGTVRYFEQENQGASAARNACIRHARGELIAAIDADDMWLPAKLEKQIAVFDSDPRVDAVYCDIIDFSLTGEEAGRSRFEKKPPVRGNILEALLLRGNFIGPVLVMRRRMFEEAGGYNTSFKVSNDIEFYLRAAEHHVFDYVDEILVRRRWLPGSLEHKNILKILHNDVLLLTEWSKRRPDLFDLRKPRVARRMGVLHSRLGVEYLSRGEYAAARRHFDSARALGYLPPRNRLLKMASYSPPLIKFLRFARGKVTRAVDS